MNLFSYVLLLQRRELNVVFDKMNTKKFGYESYGEIIKVEKHFPLNTHPWLPMKKKYISNISYMIKRISMYKSSIMF